MPMNRLPCPECKAVLKSSSGFSVGQSVCCPKCETYFVVEEEAEDEVTEETNKLKKKTQPGKATTAGKKPVKASSYSDDEDDEEYERPKKKKKKKRRDDDDDEDEGGSYKNSPLRFAILGLLVIVMLVLAYFLYDKWKKGKEAANSEANSSSSQEEQPPPQQRFPQNNGGFRNQGQGQGQDRTRPPANDQGRPPAGGVPGGGGFELLGSPPLTAAEKDQLTEKFKSQLVGNWKADLGNGVTVQLVYSADGKVTETVNSSRGTQTTVGTWFTTGATGRKVLPILFAWNGKPRETKPVLLIFEDDELLQPVLGQDVIGVFRKKRISD